MALYIIRVELHGAQEQNYEVLHKEMTRLGFYRSIVNANRVEFQLPSAEYAISANSTPRAILNLAKGAANSTGRTSWILVTEVANSGSGIDWDLRILR